jgi:hypothetical protein
MCIANTQGCAKSSLCRQQSSKDASNYHSELGLDVVCIDELGNSLMRRNRCDRIIATECQQVKMDSRSLLPTVTRKSELGGGMQAEISMKQECIYLPGANLDPKSTNEKVDDQHYNTIAGPC